jgi:alkaline phosphatase D
MSPPSVSPASFQKIAMRSISRREILQYASALMAWSAAGACRAPIATTPKFTADPFTLGVASGDPLPDGVVIWTRLAPEPLRGGGMAAEAVEVKWEVAADQQMKQIVKRGTAQARPELGHAVHVDVRGLEPGRPYFYRFNAGSHATAIGRTRTAPAAGVMADKLRLAFASCQHWEHGYFTPYDHMVREDLDLVVHLGDYIYEGGPRQNMVRTHNGPEIVTLDDYRNRYALYRGDKSLRAAHETFPFVVTWDDHEVDNDYADDHPEDDQTREAFLTRRAHAYQAYFEHMPLRAAARPKGAAMQLYRRLAFGQLADFLVLDTRQYRTDQPCGKNRSPLCEGALDPKGTILGAAQEKWMMDALDQSPSRWNVIAQQVLFAEVDFQPGPDRQHSMDKWDAYQACTKRVHKFLAERKPSNPIVLTGDIHTSWVNDLKADYRDINSATIGTEFVGTSISSGGDGQPMTPAAKEFLPENPHVRFYNAQRGYVSCTVTPTRWQADYRIVPFVKQPGAPIETAGSFVVEHGKPGAQRA